nr:hypothetical protein [Tanacetum cinerariifolium]
MCMGIALSVHGYCTECAGYLYCLHPFIIPLLSLQSAVTIIQGMSTIIQGISSSDASSEVEISSDIPVTKNVVKKKQDKPDKRSKSNSELFLNQLGLNLTGTIIVMLGRMWDNDAYMLEFDGSKTIRKALVKEYGFVRYPFQLQDFDGIESSDNKYLIDVVGYMTNVERANHLKSCSRNLDFHLANHRTRKGWNFPPCESNTCKKALTRQNGQFFCQSCNKTVDYLAVVVMFNEIATALVNCSADSLMDTVDESLEDHLNLSSTLSNLIGTAHVMEIKSHTYDEYRTFESFTCWQILPSEGLDDSVGSSNLDDYPDNQPQKMKRIVHDPSIVTSSKPVEERKKSRMDVEDSETKNSSDSANARGKKGVVAPSAKKRKNEDFQQILPVIPNAKRPELRKESEDEPTWIEIPKEFFIKSWTSPIEQIVAKTYPDFTLRQGDDEYLTERAILTLWNDDVDAINENMFKKLGGAPVTYNSANEICKASTDTADQHDLY